MQRNAVLFVILVFSSGTALGATQGVTAKRLFGCSGAYKTWEVFWHGAGTTGQADLMEGETNLNWTVKVPRVPTPAGAIAPVSDQRWYRVRSQTWIPFVYKYTSMCWIGQQRCRGHRAR
jgi:hypothetical protein